MLLALHPKIVRQTKSKNRGFTMVELLAALVITGIVTASLGVGLTYLLQESQETEEETQQRAELNRALDFITEEIRMAESIEPNSGAIDISTDASDFGKDCNDNSDNLTCVLILDVPDVDQRIIYYTEPTSGNWKGPRVLRRWGPDFNADGTYSNPTTPSNWSGDLLVDRIVDNTSNTSVPTCNADETLNGDEGVAGGVYTCIQNDATQAEITLVGNLEGDSSEDYTIRGRAFARSN
ncbi:hypothetical protein PCC7418_2077 [Halothece sp. PCC 7418]|uniref:prepilin-type N-terminal cleavage/methylation domain-containing protein n=1 Tax=Halothece sp. (strain PCC 7418) TaxID=65093 RepID=UPI0002A08322|nr:prepilin-type N-terminal cleavage/methylation domain-containing protein [Halothece sp. PCC 7418]AFZ44240.1 hypothetical protein PCC7418_2077 [Halothece sp. PCC 7418]